jgi:hypothetical protein
MAPHLLVPAVLVVVAGLSSFTFTRFGSEIARPETCIIEPGFSPRVRQSRLRSTEYSLDPD